MMENAVNRVEMTNDKEEVVVAGPERMVVPDASCLVCASGVNPTILGGEYQEALKDAL
jgi:hypothetical protein